MPSFLERAEKAAADAVAVEKLLVKARRLVADLEAALASEREQEARFRRMATDEVLTEVESSVNTTVNTQMEKSQRLAISRSKRKKGDSISAAINKAGLSKNDVAEKIGVTPAALSRYISGDRKIPRDRAEQIQAATKGLVALGAWKNLASDDA